ncbi:hypothetical protein CCACVL1_19283 [Corchorus capsularis]|uniref:Uncharacterized protein n=1 Tax=Corchorus capsularis TaxID=210143 RepID=A0A1R3HHK6_COCAP|nr:hypothetical protein CCACVL1_19283 [Corchorus capsularis]
MEELDQIEWIAEMRKGDPNMGKDVRGLGVNKSKSSTKVRKVAVHEDMTTLCNANATHDSSSSSSTSMPQPTVVTVNQIFDPFPLLLNDLARAPAPPTCLTTQGSSGEGFSFNGDFYGIGIGMLEPAAGNKIGFEGDFCLPPLQEMISRRSSGVQENNNNTAIANNCSDNTNCFNNTDPCSFRLVGDMFGFFSSLNEKKKNIGAEISRGGEI